MATDQTAITQTITQAGVEAAKAALQSMAVAMSEGSSGARSKLTSAGSKVGGPMFRQLTFKWG